MEGGGGGAWAAQRGETAMYREGRMNEKGVRGKKKENKRGQKNSPSSFFSLALPLSSSGSYTAEIVDQVNGEIDEKTEDRESEQMKR